ncbi:MAG TPA: outer membrane beta-barrel protein [Candidatus Limnocylindria bacterium]|nr:outer membrane beta-barrel protein [Candidatus Limnocylindria bacterium]
MKTTLTGVPSMRALDRALIGAALLMGMLLLAAQVVRAGEIIPSIGITKTVDSDGDEAKVFGGLAFRGNLLPFLKTEIGAAYRSESRFNDNLKVRMWPVTASLWLAPVPVLYAGGGVGWYHTTLDYDDSLPFSDETSQKFGVHLGGGFAVPLAPMVGLDLNGRYIFLEQETSQLPPNEFDPDYWSTSLGLAIKF